MRTSFTKRLSVILVAATFALACAFMAGCGSSSSEDQVAATILGENITEGEITDYIDSFRTGNSCEDDSDWASYLASRDMTAEDMRSTTIYELAAPIVIKNKADELGIEVDEDAVDLAISQLKETLLASDDDDWEGVLEEYGTTEEKVRETYGNKNLREQVLDEVIDKDITPNKTDIKNYVEANLLGTTVKYVEVAYGPDYTTMQSKLGEVQDASSVAEGMKTLKKGADDTTYSYQTYGWDEFASLSSNVTEAVADLSKGEILDHVLADEGYYVIVYVKDSYTFPSKISKFKISSLSKSLKKGLKTATVENLRDSLGSVWVKQQIEENITINDMPSGLSYDVSTEGVSTGGDSSTSNSSASSDSTAADSSSKSASE